MRQPNPTQPLVASVQQVQSAVRQAQMRREKEQLIIQKALTSK